MHLPIMLAITDQRLDIKAKRLDFDTLKELTFEPKNEQVFVAPRLAKEILSQTKFEYNLIPCIFNTANEVAVQLFLQDKIRFVDISSIVEEAINHFDGSRKPTMESVFECDKYVRQQLLRQYL